MFGNTHIQIGKRLLTLIISLILMSCGTTIRVKGDTQHNVSGSVETKNTIVFTIDTSGCLDVPIEQRLECIKTLVKALEELKNVAEILSCASLAERASGQSGLNLAVACWQDSSVASQ